MEKKSIFQYLEQIKEDIIQEYVNKGLVELIKSTDDEKEIHVVKNDEWKDYRKLKERGEGLIGFKLR